jgi:hypothetical protein
VCQTCFPYAEGNGDSISAAVQSERIALLTSVLAQAQSGPQPLQSTFSHHQHNTRSHSLTPPHVQHSFAEIAPKFRGPVHRSQSHVELSAQYANSRPIYQTSYLNQSSPYSYNSAPLHLHAPAPLLPSFLQDIVQSPTVSPASTSSADLSFEEYGDSIPSPLDASHRHNLPPSSGRDLLSVANIWRLDGDESKSLSAFALPNHQDLMGTTQKGTKQSRSKVLV